MLRGHQKRFLSIHEHASMSLLSAGGIPVPRGALATSALQAKELVAKLGLTQPVIKAQVLAGGRGKGSFSAPSGLVGGVHVLDSPDGVESLVDRMIGHQLVTKQTGAEGRPCNSVYIVERKQIARELYLAVLMDRSVNGPVLVASRHGGMDIEAVAKTNPEDILKLPVDISKGLGIDEAVAFARKLGFEKESEATECGQVFVKLYNLFVSKDATMVEINPLAQLEDGSIMCMDAKFGFDDNAEWRQPEIFSLRDTTQEDKREVEAHKWDLNYIGLDGEIGCLVNGAGLAMATMDIIKLHGGSPANFLDVGGSATPEQVTQAFKIISADPRVKTILVNIFGGIMRCDVIAEGIIKAVKELGMTIPLVVRLQGTNVDEAKALIANSGLEIIGIDDLDAAAKKAVSISASG
ncbi:MAG: hypothetical protein SGCHY_002871 [Lobulomycetales sp.]